MRALRAVLGVVAVLAYPLFVYVGIGRMSPRAFALVFAVVALVLTAARFELAKKHDLAVLLRAPLAIVALASLSAFLDDPRFVMALPVLINLALLQQFGSSLRSTPLVERFARLVEDDLSDAQVRYCRTVTIVWCAFFVANAAIAGWLAAFARPESWALYTGLVSYVLMGTLGACEYVVRKARFRKFGSHVLDRALSRIFPPG